MSRRQSADGKRGKTAMHTDPAGPRGERSRRKADGQHGGGRKNLRDSPDTVRPAGNALRTGTARTVPALAIPFRKDRRRTVPVPSLSSRPSGTGIPAGRTAFILPAGRSGKHRSTIDNDFFMTLRNQRLRFPEKITGQLSALLSLWTALSIAHKKFEMTVTPE